MLDSNTWNHLFLCKQIINIKIELLVLDNNTWNHLIMCKQMSYNLFENKISYKRFTYKSNIYERIWY